MVQSNCSDTNCGYHRVLINEKKKVQFSICIAHLSRSIEEHIGKHRAENKTDKKFNEKEELANEDDSYFLFQNYLDIVEASLKCGVIVNCKKEPNTKLLIYMQFYRPIGEMRDGTKRHKVFVSMDITRVNEISSKYIEIKANVCTAFPSKCGKKGGDCQPCKAMPLSTSQFKYKFTGNKGEKFNPTRTEDDVFSVSPTKRCDSLIRPAFDPGLVGLVSNQALLQPSNDENNNYQTTSCQRNESRFLHQDIEPVSHPLEPFKPSDNCSPPLERVMPKFISRSSPTSIPQPSNSYQQTQIEARQMSPPTSKQTSTTLVKKVYISAKQATNTIKQCAKKLSTGTRFDRPPTPIVPEPTENTDQGSNLDDTPSVSWDSNEGKFNQRARVEPTATTGGANSGSPISFLSRNLPHIRSPTPSAADSGANADPGSSFYDTQIVVSDSNEGELNQRDNGEPSAVAGGSNSSSPLSSLRNSFLRNVPNQLIRLAKLRLSETQGSNSTSNAGLNTFSNAGSNTLLNAGSYTSSNAGTNTFSNTGTKNLWTADSFGSSNAGSDTFSNVGLNTSNSGLNTPSTAGANTGLNASSNAASNTGFNARANPPIGSNTGFNVSSTTDLNAAQKAALHNNNMGRTTAFVSFVNTGSNSGFNPGFNAGYFYSSNPELNAGSNPSWNPNLQSWNAGPNDTFATRGAPAYALPTNNFFPGNILPDTSKPPPPYQPRH